VTPPEIAVIESDQISDGVSGSKRLIHFIELIDVATNSKYILRLYQQPWLSGNYIFDLLQTVGTSTKTISRIELNKDPKVFALLKK